MSGVRVRINDGAWKTTDGEGVAVLKPGSPLRIDIDQIWESRIERATWPGFEDGYDVKYQDQWRLHDVTGPEVTVVVDDYDFDGQGCTLSGRFDVSAGEQVRLDIEPLPTTPGIVTSESTFETDLGHRVRGPFTIRGLRLEEGSSGMPAAISAVAERPTGLLAASSFTGSRPERPSSLFPTSSSMPFVRTRAVRGPWR